MRPRAAARLIHALLFLTVIGMVTLLLRQEALARDLHVPAPLVGNFTEDAVTYTVYTDVLPGESFDEWSRRHRARVDVLRNNVRNQ